MALDALKWLKEDMGFSDAEAQAQVALYTPERMAKIEAAQLRQADYSREMNKLKTEIATGQTALKEAQERLDAEVAEWATVQAQGKEATAKMRTDLEAAQNDVLKFQQALKRTADANGLKYDDLVAGIVVTPPVKTNEPPPVDTSKFVTADAHGALTRMALRLPAQLSRIQHEHHELTGEWLDAEKIIAEIETRAADPRNKKSLEARDVWEEMHGIPEKREAKAKATHDAEIKAAEQRGREAALSEQHLPMGSTPASGHHAPVFRGEHTSKLQRPTAAAPNQAAVTALRTGKYRSQPTGAPAAK